jgi:hypothetical protein
MTRRRLLIVAAVVSALALVLDAATWALSRFWFASVSNWQNGLILSDGTIAYFRRNEAGVPYPIVWHPRSDGYRIPGAMWAGFHYVSSAGSLLLGIPLWLPTVVSLAVLTWNVRRLRRRPPGPGACPSCGYDLRATPGRCPECGAVPAGVTA